MGQVVLNKRNDSGNAPAAAKLQAGEIAVGYKKGSERLYIKNNSGEVKSFISEDAVNSKLSGKSNNGHEHSKLLPASLPANLNDFNDGSSLRWARFSGNEIPGIVNKDGMIISIPWSNTSYGYQIAVDDQSVNMSVRAKSGSSWTGWKQLAFQDDSRFIDKRVNPNSLKIQRNGIDVATYDGSSEITANITIPDKLEADGGNADTVDNEHASAFVHVAGDTISGNIVPNADNTLNLGSSSAMFSTVHTRYLDTSSGYYLRFKAAGNEYMTLTTSGNLGIGVTEPSQKLDVNGNIRIAIKNDEYGLLPSANNYNQIGSSSQHFYRGWINQMNATAVTTTTLTASGNATAAGFVKSGSNDNYVLTGGGSHKAISGLSTNESAKLKEHIINGVDLDTLTGECKIYYAGGSNSNTNKPSGVDAFGLLTMKDANGYTAQLCSSSNQNPGLYFRTMSDGASGTWYKMATVNDIPTVPVIPDKLPADGGNADTVDGKHASDFYPMTGGPVNGVVRSKAYDYVNNNNASFIFDKPGSYFSGIGANGETSVIKLGACNEYGGWVDSTMQTWKFNGNVQIMTADDDYGVLPSKNNYNQIGSSAMHFYRGWINQMNATAVTTTNLTASGNATAAGFVKTGSSDSYVLLGGGGHHKIGNVNGDIEILVDFPGYGSGDVLKTGGYIDSRYGTEGFGYPDEEYLKAICKWCCAEYGQDGVDKILCGRIGPNSQGYCHIHLYNGAPQSETKNPRYCSGVYYSLGGTNTPFGFVDYNWYYGGTFNGSASYASSAGYANSAGTAGTADNAKKLNGYTIYPGISTKGIFGGIPFIKDDGVMEIGTHLDFHYDASELDFSTRLRTSGNHQNTVLLPSDSGTLTTETWVSNNYQPKGSYTDNSEFDFDTGINVAEFTVANTKTKTAGNVISTSGWSWAGDKKILLGSDEVTKMRYTCVPFRNGNIENAWQQQALLFLPTYEDSHTIYIAQMHTASEGGAANANTSIKKYEDIDTIIATKINNSKHADTADSAAAADTVHMGSGSSNKFRNVWFNNDATNASVSGNVIPVSNTNFQYNPDSSTLRFRCLNLCGYTAEGLDFGSTNPRIEFGNTSNQQRVQILYTDWDNYRPDAGIKVAGEQKNTWLEVDGTVYATKMRATSGFFDDSDERLKNFEDDINVDLNRIKQIPKKYFTWKDKEKRDDNIHIGTSAQEVQKLFPELVLENSDGYLSVDYAKLSIVALKAVDELNDKNKKLEKEVSELKEMVMKLIENNK